MPLRAGPFLASTHVVEVIGKKATWWLYGIDLSGFAIPFRQATGKMTFVIGPSGSGKPALVFAGLGVELHKRQPNTGHIQTIRQ